MNEDKNINEPHNATCCIGVGDWVAVTDALPKAKQTVWLTNGKKWCCLGCLIEDSDGWHWAESNGTIYIEDGEIVSECESEDLDVKYWHELPKPPVMPIENKYNVGDINEEQSANGKSVGNDDMSWTVNCPNCEEELECSGYFDSGDTNKCDCGTEFRTRRVYFDNGSYME